MKAGRPKSVLTQKEEQIMKLLWNNGALSVRQMLELLPEPRPHQNSVSTIVRILEQKGHVSHTSESGVFIYRAVTEMDNVRHLRLSEVIRNYFSCSYMSVVSALVKEEKISVDELRELIDMVERGEADKK